MKKFILTLVLLFTCNINFAQNISDEKLEESFKKAIQGSVQISIETTEGVGTCSGVIIKNTPEKSIILTAKHCVALHANFYIDNYLVNLIGVAPNEDLAYLIINQEIKNYHSVIISDMIPRRGDNIFAIGYPFNFFISFGQIFLKTFDYYYGRIKIVQGCSGGGLFNEYGELIGISIASSYDYITGKFERLEDIHKFIKINNLLDE